MTRKRATLGVLVAALMLGLIIISSRRYHVDLGVEVPSLTDASPRSVVQSLVLSSADRSGARRGSDEVIRGDDSDCRDLPAHLNFSSHGSVRLCFDSAACSGRILLHVPGCEKYKRALSRNATHHQWILEQGADFFRARIDGPESHAVMSHLDGQSCRYAVDLPHLQLQGQYTLSLEWLYSDYHALDEITNQWPNLKQTPVLPLDDTFQTNYHLQQCTLPSRIQLACHPTKSSGGSVEAQPPCTGLEQDTSGRWVTMPDQPWLFTRVRVRKIQRNPIIFQWALQDDASREWRPNSCAARRWTHTQLAAGLRGKRVIVGGDSQLRALYFGLVNFLSGFGNECLRNISTVSAEPPHCISNVKGSHRKVINGAQVDFVDDLFLDRLGDRYRSYHVVITGFAQHPASREHWSFDKYRSAFMSKMPRLEELRDQVPEGKGVVMWYLAPQYPHTRSGYPVVVKDWRTDPRLLMFNEFAKAECLQRRIPVVDGFRISTAMSHTSPDQAHFTNFVSYEFVTMVANIICGLDGFSCRA
jgi:hypothetical protein